MKKQLLGLLSSFAILMMPFSTVVSASDAQEAKYQTAVDGEWIIGTFSDAVNNVYDGGTVQLISDVAAASGYNIQKDITITSADSQAICKIIIQANHGTLFAVSEGGELQLRNVIVDGGSKDNYTSTSSLIGVNGGLLRLQDGASIQNNNNTRSTGGGIVLIKGNVVMEEGSQIDSCNSKWGGGAAIGPDAEKFIMNGGSIRNCESSINGGGVYIAGAEFLLKAGTIENNTTHASNIREGGGGIFISRGKVLIQGGEIKNNTSDFYGGGIFVYAGEPPSVSGTVEMTAGLLSGNTARFGGGLAGVSGQFIISGGSITENYASVYGGGILSPHEFYMYLSGNPNISGNKSEDGYDNLYLDGNEDLYPDMATWPINISAAVGDNVRIGISRWIKPNDEHPMRIVAVPADGYTITKADRGKFFSDDPELSVIWHEGNLVLARTSELKHENAQFKEEISPTCIKTGTIAHFYCDDCGKYFEADVVDPNAEELEYTLGDEITDSNGDDKVTEEVELSMPIADHKYGDWEVTKAATCITKGIETKTCSVCNAKETRELSLDSSNHASIITDKAAEPSCTSTGLTAGSHCSSCGKTLAAQVILPKAEHTAVTDEAVEASCTSTGLTEGSHCSVCGETLVEQTILPMAEHTAVTDEAVEASCTSTGLTEGSHCSVCGETLVEQTILPITEHTEVTDKAVEPSCTSTGLTDGSHCSVCGETLAAQTILPKTEHTAVTDEAVEASCTKTGLTEGSHCSVCGETLIAQKVTPALGHNYKNGKCTVCGEKDPAYVLPAKNITTNVPKEAVKVKQAKITKMKVRSKAKKTINVIYRKVKGAKGYEIEVSRSRKFKASKKVLTRITSKLKLKIKSKKIKSGKTYYVRARAYTVYVNDKGVTKKVYSRWNYILRKVKVK